MATLTETQNPEVQERRLVRNPAVTQLNRVLPLAPPREYRVMFSDSILESDSPEKKRRTWTSNITVTFNIAAG